MPRTFTKNGHLKPIYQPVKPITPLDPIKALSVDSEAPKTDLQILCKVADYFYCAKIYMDAANPYEDLEQARKLIAIGRDLSAQGRRLGAEYGLADSIKVKERTP